MHRLWYLSQNGAEPQGPLPSQEILRRIASGQVTANAMVCQPGEAWVALPAVDIFDAALKYQATSAPPVAGSTRPTSTKRTRNIVLGSVAALAIAAAVVASARLAPRPVSLSARTKAAVVRIVTSSGSGSGFFISGPDRYVYLATAYHVVSRGERVLVERDMEVSDNNHYVQAYPETQVVAFDADADVAVLQIKNLPVGSVERLALADTPMKDEPVSSYGFPGSNLTAHAGLVSSEGKVQSMVKFAVYDWVYHKALQENAVDGLLVSTSIEPGFSGGPTCNGRGEVVGINVTKDAGHAGQNGVVSVTILKQLVSKIPGTDQRPAPKPEEIASLLKRIQSEYLMLPVDRRQDHLEGGFLSALDLSGLRRILSDIRRNERDTNPESIEISKDVRLSGRAMLGIFFSKLPGRTLETFEAASTRTQVSNCEETSRRLINFLGGFSNTSAPSKAAEEAARDECDSFALRPLAWDLIAATLLWDGVEKDVSVVDIKQADNDIPAYRASVRMNGIPNLVDIWVATDEGKLRLKIFDNDGGLYATKASMRSDKNAFAGSWSASNPRVTNPELHADEQTEETLAISFQDESQALIQHRVHRHFFGSRPFSCSLRSDIDVTAEQTFSGKLENGSIVTTAQKNLENVGRDKSCPSMYGADRMATFKLIAGRLYMYRTEGGPFPEHQDFQRAL